MFPSTILTLLLGTAITSTVAAPSPRALVEARNITDAPIYYLANCYAYPYDASYNDAEYGAIGYYAHSETLPTTPSKISVLYVGDLVRAYPPTPFFFAT